jgi:hypothetical protein
MESAQNPLLKEVDFSQASTERTQRRFVMRKLQVGGSQANTTIFGEEDHEGTSSSRLPVESRTPPGNT